MAGVGNPSGRWRLAVASDWGGSGSLPAWRSFQRDVGMSAVLVLPPHPSSGSLRHWAEVETSCAVLPNSLRPSHCFEFQLLPLRHRRVPSPEQQDYELMFFSFLGAINCVCKKRFSRLKFDWKVTLDQLNSGKVANGVDLAVILSLCSLTAIDNFEACYCCTNFHS